MSKSLILSIDTYRNNSVPTKEKLEFNRGAVQKNTFLEDISVKVGGGALLRSIFQVGKMLGILWKK